MESSDMYLFFFFFLFFVFFCIYLFLFDMYLFYKQSTNNAQTSNKYVDRKGMGLNCHGLLWAETAMGRI